MPSCSEVDYYEIIPESSNTNLLRYPSEYCSISDVCSKIDIIDFSATAVIQFRLKAILKSNDKVTSADGTDEMPSSDIIKIEIVENTSL